MKTTFASLGVKATLWRMEHAFNNHIIPRFSCRGQWRCRVLAQFETAWLGPAHGLSVGGFGTGAQYARADKLCRAYPCESLCMGFGLKPHRRPETLPLLRTGVGCVVVITVLFAGHSAQVMQASFVPLMCRLTKVLL